MKRVEFSGCLDCDFGYLKAATSEANMSLHDFEMRLSEVIGLQI